MLDSTPNIQTQLDQLRQEYLQRLPERLEAIRVCWNQLFAQWQPEALDTLHRLVHTLTGTSATFKLQALSEAARRLEQKLQSWKAQDAPSSIEWQQANALFFDLAQQVAKSLKPRDANPLIAVEPRSSNIPEHFNPRLIFLLEEDAIAAQELMLQINYFGYEIQAFAQLDQLKQALIEAIPAVIIIHLTETTAIAIDRSYEDIASLNQWRTLCQVQSRLFPAMIFISTRDTLIERLRAVRAGGDAYFTKPLNVNALIDKLDQLMHYSQLDPYRVLIVEDDRELAEFHALMLQQAGMITAVVTDPVKILQPLNEFNPDLILMDIYMPSCSGLELATVIRQQVAYVSIPIVFLSSETDLNKQLTAMSLGGDDFLTKPIQPQHLISSVVSRAQRSTTLRSYMVRDSLTGLFNHTKLKEQLAIELKRAHRQNSQLAFVMIDIDHFKQVNDTYGHPTGDRVIKSLSRLLRQRLRQTDIIGRYGGEEFAVILVDTDAIGAIHIMNQIRQSFAQVQQWAEGAEFNTTFSCGIALSSSHQTVTQISKAADEALYQAKRAGRNQVMLAAN